MSTFKLSIGTQLIGVWGVALLSAGIVSGLSHWQNSRYIDQMVEDASRNHRISAQLQSLSRDLTRIEAAQRGYVGMGGENNLVSYQENVAAILADLKLLQDFGQKSPEQVEQIWRLNRLLSLTLIEIDSPVRARQTQGLESSLRSFRLNPPLDLIPIQNLISEIERLELEKLKQQQTDIRGQLSSSLIVTALGGFFFLAITGLGLVMVWRDSSRRYRLSLALRDSEERFRSFMNNSNALSYIKDQDGRYVYVNSMLERTFNVRLEEIKGQTEETWLSAEAVKLVQENDRKVLASGTSSEFLEITKDSAETHRYWLSFKFPLPNSFGSAFLGGVSVEITDRILLERSLSLEKELAQVTLSSIGDAVITTDVNQMVRSLNTVAEKLTGWNGEQAYGRPLAEVMKVIDESTREIMPNPIGKALVSGKVEVMASNAVLLCLDGREIGIADSTAPIRSPLSGSELLGAVIVFRDVSESRHMTRQLSWHTRHDSVTCLVNRREFEDRVAQAIESATLTQQSHALCYFDLDQFKIINDTCGHLAGDELLKQIGDLLKKGIRQTDTLSRLGGDEFGLLLEYCPLERAEEIANSIRDSVNSFRFTHKSKSFTIGVSVGILPISECSPGVDELLRAADAACYVAKNNGRDRVQVYEANDQGLALKQSEMQWVSRITQALEEDLFCLYYQKIAPLGEGKPEGEHYEVLLRLMDNGQVISPMAFIPAAERYHLMPLIDRWVIKTLFSTQGAHYRDVWENRHATSSSGLYSINLSGSSLNDDRFPAFLRQQLSIHNIPSSLICFEITETVAITNLKQTSEFIAEMKSIGCRFSLDDFGSGMSSFSYLTNLNVDFIKIDGSFVSRILEDPVCLVIVQAIQQISKVTGTQTIAEFVENDDIIRLLTEMGIDYAQGYGIARPIPLTCHQEL